MKTRKTQLLFALLAFFLLTGNVIANGTERKTASSLEITSDPAIELEAWMMDHDYITDFDFVAEQEESIKLENWMLVDQEVPVTNVENKNTEEKLEIESWMLETSI